MTDDEILAGILRKFFWQGPEGPKVEVHLERQRAPFIHIWGQVDLGPDEIVLLTRMHEEHRASEMADHG